MNFEDQYRHKNVFITGHTGFKGSWLTEWLLLLGARITGYSLPPPTEPALFAQLGLRGRISHVEADIRQGDDLRRALLEATPDFVFHLAAQPIVRLSYSQPRETYDTNVMGTVNVLEALRALEHPCAAVLITTDKCYAQKPSPTAYREEDALGGNDPYSSSKAAAELAIAAYRRSFFSSRDSKVALASARSGNVLGGGDWALDRLVPDCIRSLRNGKSIAIRNRSATRPWQFVLDPLSGYLQLGAALSRRLQSSDPPEASSGSLVPNEDLASAFNFGPGPGARHSVLDLVEEILRHWPGRWHEEVHHTAPHEALHLGLASDKALRLLGWSPVYKFQHMVESTVAWYRESACFRSGDSGPFVALTHRQISDYAAGRTLGKT